MNVHKKVLFLLFLLICQSLAHLCGKTEIIAHRGYWSCSGSAQNSIASLKKAQSIGIYGSEFDVWLTSDGVPIVFHDDKINGVTIEDTAYAKIKDFKLQNGEGIPVLEEYLKQGKENPETRLVLEIKPHKTKERENRLVSFVLNSVKGAGLDDQTEYISFSLNVCREIISRNPRAKVAYLNGDLNPKKIKDVGLSGIDYSVKVFQKHPEWVKEAKELGLTVNVWTVNDIKAIKEMIALRVDFITTDKPEELKTFLESNSL